MAETSHCSRRTSSAFASSSLIWQMAAKNCCFNPLKTLPVFARTFSPSGFLNACQDYNSIQKNVPTCVSRPQLCQKNRAEMRVKTTIHVKTSCRNACQNHNECQNFVPKCVSWHAICHLRELLHSAPTMDMPHNCRAPLLVGWWPAGFLQVSSRPLLRSFFSCAAAGLFFMLPSVS